MSHTIIYVCMCTARRAEKKAARHAARAAKKAGNILNPPAAVVEME